MNIHQTVLGCKHPIVAVAMNKVSDLKLAIACTKAGIMPSMSAYNYYHIKDLGQRYVALMTDIGKFKAIFNHANFLLSISDSELKDSKLMDLFVKAGVKHIELAPDFSVLTHEQWPEFSKIISDLKQLNVKVFLKCLVSEVVPGLDFGDISGIVVKGQDAAGRFDTRKISLVDAVKEIRRNYPNLWIIPAGGVSTSEQLNELIEAGAVAVGFGTIFAASEESCISKETKLKMIGSSENDIKVLPQGELQKGIIFSKIEGEWDSNNTKSLKAGIASPTQGHIFASKAIESVKEILPVQKIVDKLVG